MNPNTEARLRAALAGRAALVTPESLTDQRPAADVLRDDLRLDPHEHAVLTPPMIAHTPRRPRKVPPRWSTPLLAAAAVVGLVAGTTAVAKLVIADRPGPSTPGPRPTVATELPSPSGSAGGTSVAPPTSTSPTPAPSLLPPGRQADRSAIPWSQVGAGWAVATTTSSANGGSATVEQLWLLNPIGGRYLITGFDSQWTFALASPDERRALLYRVDGARTDYREIDLASGATAHSFSTPGNTQPVTYTRPRGLAVLVVTGDLSPSARRLQRYSTGGQLQLSYPTFADGVGLLQAGPAIYLDDGSDLVVGAGQGAALLGNDGHVVRVFPAPSGYHGCYPDAITSGSVQLTCQSDSNPELHNVFRQPLDGGTPTAVAPLPPHTLFGYVRAWDFSGGTLLAEEAACGPPDLVVRTGSGIAPLHPNAPATLQTRVEVVDVVGDSVWLKTRGCSGGTTLFRDDLTTGAVTVLLGPSTGSGAFWSGRVFDR